MAPHDIVLIEQPTSWDVVRAIAQATFGEMAKAVVDLEGTRLAVGSELHADCEAFLMQCGAKQGNLWGINLYPDNLGEDRVEFDSMINIRPAQGNKSRSVEDAGLRQSILEIVDRLIK